MRSNVKGPYFLAQNMLLSGFTYDFNCSEASVKLADFANASPPSDYKISSKSFRSPESWLGLPWGPPADIWSFGAVIGSLIMGPYGELFGSSAENEEEAEIEMLQKQNSMTDPYPLALLERAGGDWPAPFQVFADMDEDQRERVTWRLVIQELQLPEEDGAFIERVLKIDPAERPTANALLKDKWFAE
ncbi:kinase-like domain-containing protein [Leptodontidium sp. 2 PMI_412]|nr:kinase-like domain-containing protein [Leptodontidium sp. 2 PMI_412]